MKKKKNKDYQDTIKLLRQQTIEELFQYATKPQLPTEWPASGKAAAELINKTCHKYAAIAMPIMHWVKHGNPSIGPAAQEKMTVCMQLLPCLLSEWIQTMPFNKYTVAVVSITTDNELYSSYKISSAFMKDTFRCLTKALVDRHVIQKLGLSSTKRYMEWSNIDNFWYFFGIENAKVKRRQIRGLNMWCIEIEQDKIEKGLLY
jgi:hypothetical protein